MGKYDNLGSVFKNLRNNRHISLKQIADDTVSVSQLSRFERGETDLYKRTIYLFLSGLQHYKEGAVLSGIDEMKNAIHIFELVGSENLANNYKKDFARFVH